MIRALALVIVLTACAELPLMEGTISPEARAQADPQLAPLDPILAETRRISRAEAAQGPLQARGASLSSARIGRPGTADLAERGRLLRARAARLKARPV